MCFFFARHNSIKQKLLEKVEKKMNNEEEITEKAENYQLELGAKKTQNK